MLNGLGGLLLASAVLVMAGCATVAEPSADALVVQRAQMRWDALLAGKLEDAYGFLSPGSRAKMDLSDYRDRIGSGLWKGARVMRADCNAEMCEVHVMVDFRVRRPRVNVVAETAVRETWVNEDGAWWYVLKR